MKRQILLLVCLLTGMTLLSREIRTPLNVQQGIDGHLHVPLELEEEDLGHKITYDIWGAMYAQSANQAYNQCHDIVNVAQIFFGKESFRGKDVFADSTLSSPGDAAATWLNFAVLTPRVEYHENGAVLGGTIMGSWRDGSVRFGLRANLPYKVIEMDNENCDCSLGEETIQDVSRRQSDLFVAGTDPRVTLNSTIDNDWAYRLDFVSALCSSSCTIPLVEYGTGAGVPTRIHGKDVTDTGNLAPDTGFTQGNPVHLLQVEVGSVPMGLLAAAWNPAISTSGFISGSGAGAGVGTRVRFDDGTDYTALAADPDAQSQFWLVPTLVKNGGANELATSNDANEIRNMIEQLLNEIDFSAANFFANNGISFASQTTRGIGDLATQLFLGGFASEKLYGEVQLGVSFPTGKRVKNPNLVYKMPTGNNGHFEIAGGLMGWWHAVDTVALKADASYHWVLNRSERVAESFQGATVKNINPIVNADISWQYFIGHIDLTFLHPENPGLGFDIGYEFYWKKQDNICFKGSSCSSSCEDDGIPFATVDGNLATDFFGNFEPLDPCVLERYTKRVSNKLRIEFFHHWNFGDLYAGWSQVFYGKNIMRETSYYFGMSINF